MRGALLLSPRVVTPVGYAKRKAMDSHSFAELKFAPAAKLAVMIGSRILNREKATVSFDCGRYLCNSFASIMIRPQFVAF